MGVWSAACQCDLPVDAGFRSKPVYAVNGSDHIRVLDGKLAGCTELSGYWL